MSDKNENKPSFIVWQEISDVIDRLTDEQAGKIFRAMLEYNHTGIEPDLDSVLSIIFIPIKQSMDRNKARYQLKCEKNRENIKKRWKKQEDTNVYDCIRSDTNVYEPIPTDTKAYLSDNERDRDREPERDREIDITESQGDSSSTPSQSPKKKDRPIRHKYGEYNNVLLTDEQMDKLKSEYPHDWGQRIERLSEYMESKGKSYKNHLATIRAWGKKDAPQPVSRSEPAPKEGKFFSRMGDIDNMTDEERKKECALLEEKLRKKV